MKVPTWEVTATAGL